MKIRALLTSTVLFVIPAVGCAQKESATAPTMSPPSSAASAPSTAPVMSETKTCATQDGSQIKINGEGISCAEAYTIAKGYDLRGEKYQRIEAAVAWTCYTGTIESRPLIFQCVSGQGTEFGVYPAE